MKKKPLLTISIVNYQSENYLIKCIKSILKFPPPFQYQITVFDNSPQPDVKKQLNSLSPEIIYQPSDHNLGFAQAQNLALEKAKGDYYLILNPDITLIDNSLWFLIDIISSNHQVAAVGPKILTPTRQVEKSISRFPDPIKGLIYYSFLDKYLFNQRFSKRFRYLNHNLDTGFTVETITGAVVLVKSKIFKQLNGFDNRYFLYFEDIDLCKRISQAGYQIIYSPQARVIHQGGGSLLNNQQRIRIFQQSRFYYFKKHHSIIPAVLLECWLRLFEYLKSIK